MLRSHFEEVKDSLGDNVSIISDVDKTSKFQVNIKFVIPYHDFVSKRKTVMEQSGVLSRRNH
jgi:hypothetical protein